MKRNTILKIGIVAEIILIVALFAKASSIDAEMDDECRQIVSQAWEQAKVEYLPSFLR